MKQLILFILLLTSATNFAQGGEKIKERIKAQKVAFITDKLELTSEEAQKFWPIYNEIEVKKEELRKESVLKRKEKKPEDLTEEEAKILLNEMLDIEDQKHELNRELVSKLEEVISSKKIIALMRAEREFDRKLLDRLKEFKDRRQNRRN
ncbi:sensor of ECF-type sigma factor [Winogradskyella marincola]|uniref:Sensor of ECF-type sigma factor n=1 Tax=Winogradskyella marincola TaxID=3037795 RepID=A0ABT6G3K8_9FLAO|nr:sensor of ECF-type sigma factor [Winogradskyella sp. YYF002]MDG4716629.1 sensor of ECF-type sigma factor [Winogradskyella sp. YYF002]|tara:strand:- start:1111 stop:1560 length:450 start_codon:yes stop_codon:yes gene_type:complete